MKNRAETKPNRNRGRPLGSSRLNDSDQKLLERVADRMVADPTSNRTHILRSIGIENPSEIHRLNRKWRTKQKELIAAAKSRSDVFERLGAFGGAAMCALVLNSWVTQFLQSAEAEELGKIFSAFDEDPNSETHQDKLRDEFGYIPKPPFDIADRKKVSAAIDRYSKRQHKTAEDLAQSLDPNLTTRDLPNWQKIEVVALLLHELSMQQKTRNDQKTSKGMRQNARATGDSSQLQEDGDL